VRAIGPANGRYIGFSASLAETGLGQGWDPHVLMGPARTGAQVHVNGRISVWISGGSLVPLKSQSLLPPHLALSPPKLESSPLGFPRRRVLPSRRIRRPLAAVSYKAYPHTALRPNCAFSLHSATRPR
jgi:hypothetical protein